MVTACPFDEVEAPLETVWGLLREPRQLDRWWDARVVQATPPGPLCAGQRLDTETRALGRTFALRIDVEAVDVPRHQVRMTAHLPLGLVDRATITVVPLGERRCRVSFG
jgi:hypothetical protein